MPDIINEAIICFENVSRVIMAEQALAEKKYSVRVRPTPSGIQEGCSFCLRLLPDDIEQAAAYLLEQGFTGTKAYMQEETEGRVSYKQIELANGKEDAARE